MKEKIIIATWKKGLEPTVYKEFGTIKDMKKFTKQLKDRGYYSVKLTKRR